MAVRLAGTMVPRNNIVSAATLRYEEASSIIAALFFLLHNHEAQNFLLFFFSAEANYEANFIFFTCTNSFSSSLCARTQTPRPLTLSLYQEQGLWSYYAVT